jgi:DNA-binding XRE family transcriptional regulator
VVRTFLPYTKIVEKPQSKAIPAFLETLGDHIRKRRIETNRMQQDVAKIIGVSTDCITNWENNRSQPQIHFFPAIIFFLGYYPFTHESETFGGMILHMRHCHGWTCAECGEVLGVDGSTVSAWEQSKVMPTKENRKRINFLVRQFLAQQHLSE